MILYYIICYHLLFYNWYYSELFATDWNDEEPFIVRIAMDGSKFWKIVDKDLYYPGTITIDYFAEHIYWADTGKRTIE